MGTRGYLGFKVNGVFKMAYNHYDSYPEGLGVSVMKFVKETPIAKMREVASGIILVNRDMTPTEDQIKECEKWTDLTVDNRSTSNWYCLLRGAQGDLSAYTDGLKYMLDAGESYLDEEYAYIVDLDAEVVKFYDGKRLVRDIAITEVVEAEKFMPFFADE